MSNYCANKDDQSNGDREAHDISAVKNCLPLVSNRVNLGYHDGCASAVREAKRYFSQSNDCATCAPACHTLLLGDESGHG